MASEYGVTPKGFIMKRMQDIKDEIEADQSEGFGFDVSSVDEQSFLNVLNTSFCNQLAEMWEALANTYYASYPSTAEGVNLDNAVQYGGISREAKAQTIYQITCTGIDGTTIPAQTQIKTSTKPERTLYLPSDGLITRERANAVHITVASVGTGAYTVTVGEKSYSYSSTGTSKADILNGIKALITDESYNVSVTGGDEPELVIADTRSERSNVFVLTENLTTSSVTSILPFSTTDYGKVVCADDTITVIVTGVNGLDSVTNRVSPIYGRDAETDSELRQDYASKSLLRSNTMIGSIVAELLNNVPGVITATGYENDTDKTDSNGLLPHSVELIVDGGDNTAVAEAILKRKSGGIQTNGDIRVDVATSEGDVVPVYFNRPQVVYVWLRVTVTGHNMPTDYAELIKESVLNDTSSLKAGSNLLIQTLIDGIYEKVSGVTYVKIETAKETDSATVPGDSDYSESNVEVTNRQMVSVTSTRVEVRR